MKEYLEEKIAYYKREIPIMEEALKNVEKWIYEINIEKVFNMKSNLHECHRQLQELNKE